MHARDKTIVKLLNFLLQTILQKIESHASY